MDDQEKKDAGLKLTQQMKDRGRITQDEYEILNEALKPDRSAGPARPAGMGIEYKSKRRIFGMPLFHFVQGPLIDPSTGSIKVARGFFAMGNIAVGIFAFGGFSAGIFSFGGFAVGLAAVFGGVALGAGISVGGLAVGTIAIGGCAVGYYALGGAAFGVHALGGNARDPHLEGLLGKYFHKH